VLVGTYNYSAQMPKNGPFWKEASVEIVETWIKEGAKGRASE